MTYADKLPEPRRDRIVQLICLCFLLQMWLSYALWWPEGRSFPTIPFFSDVIMLDGWLWTVLMPVLFAVSLAVGLVFPGHRLVRAVVFGMGIVVVLLDGNRLQVWSYLWIAMLGVLTLTRTWPRQRLLLQFMMIALYAWSGLNKLNVYYLDHSFPWLMQAFSFSENWGGSSGLAILSALVEVGIAVGLYLGKTRQMAVVMALLFHLLILLILGPVGHYWNQVVWPWNGAMMALVFLLFWSDKMEGIGAIWRSGWLGKALLVGWGVLPVLNIVHCWDEQLSFKMYSGAYTEGILYSPASARDCFPNGANIYYDLSVEHGREKRLILDEWSMMEMGVPPYVSERTMRSIARQWCRCVDQPKSSGLEILRVNRWSRQEKPLIRLSCEQL